MKKFYWGTNLHGTSIAIDINCIYKVEETEMGNTVIWYCYKGKHMYDVVKESMITVMTKLEKIQGGY